MQAVADRGRSDLARLPPFLHPSAALLLTPVPCDALNSVGFDTPGGAGLQKSCSSSRSAAGLLLLAAWAFECAAS